MTYEKPLVERLRNELEMASCRPSGDPCGGRLASVGAFGTTLTLYQSCWTLDTTDYQM